MNWKKAVFVKIAENKRKLAFVKRSVCFLSDAITNINNDHLTNGEYWLQKVLAVQKPLIIFDVGANRGGWSERISIIYPSVTIYAFEPVPEMFSQLIKRLEQIPKTQIVPIQAALSNEQTRIVFFQNANQSLFSSLYRREDEQSLQEITVDTTTGDLFCSIQQIDNIDFMKIDVEGAEWRVLKGFENMLQNGKIKVIQFEYGVMNISARTYLKDFYELLLPLGYKIGKLYPNWVEFTDYSYKLEDFKWANYVAVLASEDAFIQHISGHNI